MSRKRDIPDRVRMESAFVQARLGDSVMELIERGKHGNCSLYLLCNNHRRICSSYAFFGLVETFALHL